MARSTCFRFSVAAGLCMHCCAGQAAADPDPTCRTLCGAHSQFALDHFSVEAPCISSADAYLIVVPNLCVFAWVFVAHMCLHTIESSGQ